ncbi:GntR family transcriptional regulator [Paraburkholderia caballeronis]|uniref:GntR family transcriptional regulator n=1 Tax=Paraburkholderia caballeronis TaxID=416943 RepID=UPI00106585FB|nr:GntR family transcriptional regulator [Paraburkholderia caballeronis]TDV33702.1 GntR family transcriptional regulator [Paraburkholderia caballeronis]
MKSIRNDPDAFIGRVLPASLALDRSMALSTQIYQCLREAIITMALQPNDVIFERAIAEALGVSRTPVREALLQLAREDLVMIAAQSRTFVAPVRREQFVESALIRQVLEIASIRRAAEIVSDAELDQLHDIHEAHRRAVERGNPVAAIRHDNAFHAAVSQSARLPKMQQLVELVRAPIDRVRHITVRDPVVADVTLSQHQQVLDALLRHDPDAAERALRDHLDDAFERQKIAFDANVALFEGTDEPAATTAA